MRLSKSGLSQKRLVQYGGNGLWIRVLEASHGRTIRNEGHTMGTAVVIVVRLRRVALLLSLVFCGQTNAAANCVELNDFASKNGVFIPGEDSGRTVVGKRRLQFYSAPNYSCELKGVFVVEGQTLNAYTQYKGFVSVVYLSDREKKPVLGWVRSNRLKPNDRGIAPSQE